MAWGTPRDSMGAPPERRSGTDSGRAFRNTSLKEAGSRDAPGAGSKGGLSIGTILRVRGALGSPLRRVAVQIANSSVHEPAAVPELTKAAVAGEAKHSSHFLRPMAMIDVPRRALSANCASTPLSSNEHVELALGDAVPELKQKVSRAAIEPILFGFGNHPMAGPAVGTEPILRGAVPHKVTHRLHLLAPGAALSIRPVFLA